MKTVGIPVEIKAMMEEFGDGKSINQIIEILLEDLDIPNAPPKSLGNININFNDELGEKLDCCKLYATETYASVIYRLIQEKSHI